MSRKVLSIILVCGFISYTLVQTVWAQETPPTTGTLVVTVHSPLGTPLKNLEVTYDQVGHDFLYGYSGPAPVEGWPEVPYGLSFDLQCIPWVEIEPRIGIFPHQTQEDIQNSPDAQHGLIGNDCLLYFGDDALNDLPSDLGEMDIDDLLIRAQNYLEHAVRYQSAMGVSIYVIKEPGYPTSNLLGLTASQWFRLVKLACQVVRRIDPQAMIIIAIIPQYLPSRGYTPYTFLDRLIREGVDFDGIILEFSAPISAKFTSAGYPAIEWIDTQVDVFVDLGKQLILRFSGIPAVKNDSSRQTWLEECYGTLFEKSTVMGIYWDESEHHPAKLTAVNWPVAQTETEPSSESAETILKFIREHSSKGESKTDANGQVMIDAFAGIYDIRVEGLNVVTRAHIYRGEERRLDLFFPDHDATRLSNLDASTGKTTTTDDGETPVVNTGIVLFVTLILGLGLYYCYKSQGKKKDTKSR